MVIIFNFTSKKYIIPHTCTCVKVSLTSLTSCLNIQLYSFGKGLKKNVINNIFLLCIITIYLYKVLIIKFLAKIGKILKHFYLLNILMFYTKYRVEPQKGLKRLEIRAKTTISRFITLNLI
jgi:hypothetical protein